MKNARQTHRVKTVTGTVNRSKNSVASIGQSRLCTKTRIIIIMLRGHSSCAYRNHNRLVSHRIYRAKHSLAFTRIQPGVSLVRPNSCDCTNKKLLTCTETDFYVAEATRKQHTKDGRINSEVLCLKTNRNRTEKIAK